MAISNEQWEELQIRKNNATAAVRNLFASKNEELGEEDINQMLKDPPSSPSFPIFIVTTAIIKDFLDFPGEALIVTIVLTTIASFGMGIIILFWMLGKMSGGFWKKAMIKWFWKRYLLAMMLELIPFVKMVPATTILVLMAHYRETKLVKLMNGGLEILHRHGFKKGG